MSTFCIGPCLYSAVVYFSIMNCKNYHLYHRICLLQQTYIRKQYEFTDSMLYCTHFPSISVKAHWLQSPALPDSMVGVSISSTISHEKWGSHSIFAEDSFFWDVTQCHWESSEQHSSSWAPQLWRWFIATMNYSTNNAASHSRRPKIKFPIENISLHILSFIIWLFSCNSHSF